MKYTFSLFQSVKALHHKQIIVDKIDDFLTQCQSRQCIKELLEGFVAGTLKDQKRLKENVVSRSVLTYDIDQYNSDFSDLLLTIRGCLEEYIYAVYTTSTHSEYNPKVRILIPLDREVEASVFEWVSQSIFKQLFKGKLTCDKSTHQVARLMYVPHRGSKILLSKEECTDNAKVFEVTDELLYNIVNQEVNSASSEHDNSQIELSDEQIHEVLKVYKSDDLDYHGWLFVCMAISHQFLGLKKGLKIVKWWSATNKRLLHKYPTQQLRDQVIEAQYERIKNTKEKNITMRSVLYKLRSEDLEAFQRISGINEIKKAISSNQVLHYDMDRIGIFEFPDLVYNSKKKPVVESSGKNFLYLCKRFAVFRRLDIIKNEYKFYISNEEIENEDIFKASICSLCAVHNFKDNFFRNMYTMISKVDIEYNPFLDAIKIWDEKSRLQDFYNTLKVEKKYEQLRNMYLEAFLKQIVYISCEKNYIESPRYVLALGGDQGIGKSTWVRSLLPQAFAEYVKAGAIIDLSRPFEVSEILSHIICEIGEFAATMKKNDVNRLKAFLTNNIDSIDKKFKDPVKRKRSTSFICTFNDDKIFNDETGNSRFLTLPVLQCEFNHGIDMLQVFAEVRATFDCSRFTLDQKISTMQEELNNRYQVSSDIEKDFFRYFDLLDERGVFDREQFDTALYNTLGILEVMGYDKKASNFDVLAKKIEKFLRKNKVKNLGDDKYLLLQKRYVETNVNSTIATAKKAGEEKIKEFQSKGKGVLFEKFKSKRIERYIGAT